MPRLLKICLLAVVILVAVSAIALKFLGWFSSSSNSNPVSYNESSTTENGQEVTFQDILNNIDSWENKTVKFKRLQIDLQQKCRHLYRQGEFCATDGTASITAKLAKPGGKGLSPAVPVTPGQHFGEEGLLSREEAKNRTFEAKVKIGVVKALDETMPADNIVGGTKRCEQNRCFITNGKQVFLKILTAEWNK